MNHKRPLALCPNAAIRIVWLQTDGFLAGLVYWGSLGVHAALERPVRR